MLRRRKSALNMFRFLLSSSFLHSRVILLFSLLACSSDRAPVVSHPALAPKNELVAEEPKPVAPPDRTIDISRIDRTKIQGLAFEAKAIEKKAPPPRAKAK